MNNSRNIELPNGGTLHIDMTDQFMIVLRNYFKLSVDDYIQDDHIRMFMFGAVKTALDKVETNESANI